MKRIFFTVVLFFLSLVSSCQLFPKTFSITEPKLIELNIGQTSQLSYVLDLETTTWENSNPNVVFLEELNITALSKGLAIITAVNENKVNEYYVLVKEEIINLTIEGKQNILVNEEIILEAIISPRELLQDVVWTNNDSSIVELSEDGQLIGLQTGLATITATSVHDPSYKKDYPIMVYEEYTDDSEKILINKFLQEHEIINSLNFMNLLSPLIKTSQGAVIGINSYADKDNSTSLLYSGSGVIYRRDIILQNNEIIEDYESVNDYINIKEFKYYVMTNRHVVKDTDNINIYYNSLEQEIKASLCQYDPKVDFAIITFSSRLYFPLARFGDSDLIETGEFVYTIGHPFSPEYFRSSSLGIISFTKRYVNDDTDGDDIADWHSEYIQHDAVISPGNSGGGLFNLRGELIGINTTKIVDSKVDDMGFAVPINLAVSISPLLEAGIQPQRAVLGIAVIDVNTIINFPSEPDFVDIVIPEGITRGLYVKEVNTEGLGKDAGLIPGDIILSFDGVVINKTYMFRIVLVKHAVGSGDIVPLEINRAGVNMTLYVRF